jgi:hypothetical protein
VRLSAKALASLFAAAVALAGCGKRPGGGGGSAGAGEQALVRVRVPEAKCEVAIPATMTIANAKESAFRIVEKGKDPTFDGMLVVITPVGAGHAFAPPDATDVKIDKDKTNPDGSAELEGSYRNAVQTLFVAEYTYPLGKSWLHCNISAAKVERRNSVAKLCGGLAPKVL